MKIQLRRIYELSKKFSPPKRNLQQGRIADDGDATSAELSVNHRDPNDVSVKELEYYNDVWGFLEPEDLLFYLHPVLHLGGDLINPPPYASNFLDRFDSLLPVIAVSLNRKQAVELSNILMPAIPDLSLKSYPNIWTFCVKVH